MPAPRPGEAAALDLSEPAAALRDVEEAEARSLLAAAAGDGVSELAVAGSRPGEELLAEARAAGLRLVPSAEAALVPRPLPDEEAGLGTKSIYARRDAITPTLVAAATRPGVWLVVTEPFPEAARWARATGGEREGALGHAAALMAQDAALLAGRTASVARLEAALGELAAREVAIVRLEAPAGGTIAAPQDEVAWRPEPPNP